MPRASNGTYTLPAGNPVVTATVISSTWGNTTMSDIATALTDSLSRSGQGPMTATLQLASGVIGTPGLSWSSEPTSGLYRNAAGDFRYSIAAVDKLQLITTGLGIPAAGVVATPSLFILGDPNTGLFSGGADILSFTTGGVLAGSINATGRFNWIDGAAGTPAYSFTSDPDTGMYHIAADNPGFSAGGTYRMGYNTTVFNTRILMQGPDGAVGGPSYSFENDSDTGVYRVGANQCSISAGGVIAANFGSAEVDIFHPIGLLDGTAAAPAFTYFNDTDTGFYRDTANQIGIALAGATAGQILQGTFTGTLNGATGATGTFNYQRIGNMVRVWAQNPINGTGSTTSFNITGMPASILPTNSYVTEVNLNFQDNSATCAAICIVNGAQWSFAKLSAFNTSSSTGWTAAGVKGVGTGWTMSYPIG